MAAITAGGGFVFFVCFFTFYFAFFVCISIPYPLTPISSFFLQPSAKLPSEDPVALPPGSCPALTFLPRPGLGRLHAYPRTGLLGNWGDSSF